MEQATGIEPACRPWQGRVLPLNYACKWRILRDSNPWSSPWQGDVIGLYTKDPLFRFSALFYYLNISFENQAFFSKSHKKDSEPDFPSSFNIFKGQKISIFIQSYGSEIDDFFPKSNDIMSMVELS